MTPAQPLTNCKQVQAEALAHTTVLVTPCGSLAALAYLLPPGATAVVMNFYQASSGANVQLDEAAFWNLDHVVLAYFPVGPEDYEGTSVRAHALLHDSNMPSSARRALDDPGHACAQDRPACQKEKGDPQFEEEGALVNCNVRIADVERMEHVVGAALKRWYAEYGESNGADGR